MSDSPKKSNRAIVLLFIWESLVSIVRFGQKLLLRADPAAPNSLAAALDAQPSSERASDENIEPKREAASHARWGTFFVTLSFLLSLTAGVGFLFIYWTNGDNLLLGGTLALCFGSLGFSLVLFSHWLTLRKEATEPREDVVHHDEERREFAQAFQASEHDVLRRGLLKWMALGTMGMLAAMFVSIVRSFGTTPAPSLHDRIWKRGQRLMKSDGTPVTADALQPGDFVIVFPEESIGDERAQTMLLRVKESLLQLPSDRADWAPMGYVAYSRVCTHAGCPVGLFETTTDQLMCPCHQSSFDILRAAKPIAGPAARALPQLPLYVDAEGNLRAAGGFSEPPGPGFWGMTA